REHLDLIAEGARLEIALLTRRVFERRTGPCDSERNGDRGAIVGKVGRSEQETTLTRRAEAVGGTDTQEYPRRPFAAGRFRTHLAGRRPHSRQANSMGDLGTKEIVHASIDANEIRGSIREPTEYAQTLALDIQRDNTIAAQITAVRDAEVGVVRKLRYKEDEPSTRAIGDCNHLRFRMSGSAGVSERETRGTNAPDHTGNDQNEAETLRMNDLNEAPRGQDNDRDQNGIVVEGAERLVDAEMHRVCRTPPEEVP